MEEFRKLAVAQSTVAQGSHQSGVGVVVGNPRLCFQCRQPIGETDRWTKYTSPVDPPEYAAYSIIFHQRCDGISTKSAVKPEGA
jgi:hypothetical protein